ncbi:hypothetical protein EDC04DRAFT_2600688 [Pisolithus marmoratus]|nr:hypothetical protein EDC04DRAFT_2600688 [Pisolithus marmoratus]
MFTHIHFKSLRIQPSPVGYIAKAVALLVQGDREVNQRSAQSILVFECGNQQEAITRVEHLAMRANDDNDDKATYLYTQARGLSVLGAMYIKEENYGRAVPLIERAINLASKDLKCPSLETISLIFGWSFNGLGIVAQQRLCETLYAEQRTAEALEVLLNMIRASDEEIRGSKEAGDWIADFTGKCITTLEHADDEVFRPVKHDDAITQDSTPLSLSSLFVMRSRARAARGLWEDALQDAVEAVKADPSNPWGYEAKHVALHGAKRYDEAIDAFKAMLHAIEDSHDPAIRRMYLPYEPNIQIDGSTELRRNYISPSETIASIDSIVREILKSCPLVVIDVATGCLCDGPERTRIFKAGPMFKELVSSMTREVDSERILRVVESFFGYVMFSHAWQGNEPSFQDVNVVGSVWKLSDMPLNQKLRNFCQETRRLGYNWAWSDTCCIDKTTSSILNQSLTSMYKWYADSAATLVFLAGVWTLQELLSPKVILFYDSEWKPYLGDTGTNHKESSEIMHELADAIKIPRGNIVVFSPDDLGVREKLRLASTRNATVEEDVAYSLIGIFQSDIRPHYGEGADALGHLLEEIVARSGEVAVLAWSGKSSSYNSCLPASVSVYRQTPYNPPPLEGEEMDNCVTVLRSRLPQKVAFGIYNQINSLPPARFATRRLHLPCIVFSVRRLGIQELRRGNEKLYRARVSGLGNVEFATTDDLPLHEPQRFVFAHPWIPHIRGPSDGVAWVDNSEFDADTGSDSDSDEVASPSPLHAVPALQVDNYTRALHMIARLGQPFNALLLVQQPNRQYRRIAVENEIIVSGLGTDITSKNIRATVLEIL